MRGLMIFILWTWALTPLWVNIVGTCLLSCSMLYDFITGIIKGSE
jgi:hypothetical protein